MALTAMSMCAPISSCPCQGWTIKTSPTSETQLPLYIDWRPTLTTLPGFQITEVMSVSLTDMFLTPPGPANGSEIAIGSGLPPPPPPGEAPGGTQIIDGCITCNYVWVGTNTPVGKVYKFDISVKLRDNCGHIAYISECVSINTTS
jgi:hypothetical protein